MCCFQYVLLFFVVDLCGRCYGVVVFVFIDQCVNIVVVDGVYYLYQIVNCSGIDGEIEFDLCGNFIVIGDCYFMYVIVKLVDFQMMGILFRDCLMYSGVDMFMGLFILLVIGNYGMLLMYMCVNEVEFVIVMCSLVQVYKVYIDIVLWQCCVELGVELQ